MEPTIKNLSLSNLFSSQLLLFIFSFIYSGNLMQQRITRIQTEQANEIARLIKQYITIDQRMKGVPMPAAPQQQVNKSVP